MAQPGSVLIIATSDDLHAQAVSRTLESQFDTPCLIWDRSGIPSEDEAIFRVSDINTAFDIWSQGNNIAFHSVRSVWWRRRSPFRLDSSVSEQTSRDFCLRECDAFFRGVMDSVAAPIVNSPSAEMAARKPLQLQLARRAGLPIPKTLMTNSAKEVRAFWDAMEGECIYKPFTSHPSKLAETRILSEEDLEHLDKLRHAPIIVQQKIEKGKDIRVNIFGTEVFAATVKTRIPAAELDWRLDLTAEWEPHTLPDALSERLIRLLRLLGLHYGCIDLRQQPDGAYVFFEVNPSGQFLMVEVDTGQPLTRSLAKLLVMPGGEV